MSQEEAAAPVVEAEVINSNTITYYKLLYELNVCFIVWPGYTRPVELRTLRIGMSAVGFAWFAAAI